jgi:hypothetical protein
MDTSNPTRKIPVQRNGQLLGEYPLRELGSMLETGSLKIKDLCQNPDTGEWHAITNFLTSFKLDGPSRHLGRSASDPRRPGKIAPPSRLIWGTLLLLVFLSLGAALAAAAWAMKASTENADLQSQLAAANAANAEWQKKYQNVLFAAREVAASDLVRGKVILRDAAGKRVVLPGIKVRLYPRRELEAFLAERYAAIPETQASDPTRLARLFLKDLPPAIETSTTDSDGRFECKIPEPGEYIIQTSLRSAKTGAMRLWFVAFDSRDPLNTPVDITESNAVQQFNPLLMVVEGR